MTTHAAVASYRDLFVGLDSEVPLLDGSCRCYINLDNAASTPPLLVVQQAVNHFLTYYSSVHRGTGFKSQLATHAYEEARQVVLDFVGADPAEHVCIFTKNTTESINKLARRFPFTPQRNVVLVSLMEHHSNDLPWRAVAETVHVAALPDGRLDEADFDAKLAEYGDRLALVAITGASNVTGFINPIHRLAEKVHAAGAQIAVDCAQLAPHRAIDMRPLSDPGHLDYIALSAHKMYAPLGTGALIGRRDTFEQGEPEQRGGGTITVVMLDEVVWADAPERDEAGSPNTVGAIALAVAIRELQAIGMDAVAQHEAELTAYALRRLREVPGLKILGDADPDHAAERVGAIPFILPAVSHFLVAAVLGYEFGIGVRNGCFCAHPYIMHLLGLTPEQTHHVRTDVATGHKARMPGLIRASFGLYNTFEDVDALADALGHIARGEYQGTYIQDEAHGDYLPAGWDGDYDRYFKL